MRRITITAEDVANAKGNDAGFRAAGSCAECGVPAPAADDAIGWTVLIGDDPAKAVALVGGGYPVYGVVCPACSRSEGA